MPKLAPVAALLASVALGGGYLAARTPSPASAAAAAPPTRVTPPSTPAAWADPPARAVRIVPLPTKATETAVPVPAAEVASVAPATASEPPRAKAVATRTVRRHARTAARKARGTPGTIQVAQSAPVPAPVATDAPRTGPGGPVGDILRGLGVVD